MRQYPNIYSQRDPQWSGNELGTAAGATIGMYGCLLTCHAMKAGYYGHTITPGDLNKIYTDRKLYVSDDLLTDADINAIYGDITIKEVHDWTTVPADLNALKAWADDPTLTVTIKVDFDHNPNDGIQTHFVELHEFDGVNLTIFDPWFGTDDNFATHYGTDPALTIQKVVVYHGTPVKPGTYVDAKTFETLVTKSTANDAVCDELGLSHDVGKDAELVEINKLKVNAQQDDQTVQNLNNQMIELSKKLTEAENAQSTAENNLKICQQASTHPDTGTDYKTLYNEAESKLTTTQNDFTDYQKRTNAVIGQLRTTSYTTTDTLVLIKEVLQRVFHLK